MDAKLGHVAGVTPANIASTLNLIVSQSALADLKRLQVFLAKKNPTAAQRSVQTIIAAIDSLMLFPDRCHPSGSNGIRDLVLSFGRNGYLIRYVHHRERDEIIILRIWHGREARI